MKEAAWLVLRGNPSCVLPLKTKRKRERERDQVSFLRYFLFRGERSCLVGSMGKPIVFSSFKNKEKKTEIRFLFFVFFLFRGKEAAWLVLRGNPSCVL